MNIVLVSALSYVAGAFISTFLPPALGSSLAAIMILVLMGYVIRRKITPNTIIIGFTVFFLAIGISNIYLRERKYEYLTDNFQTECSFVGRVTDIQSSASDNVSIKIKVKKIKTTEAEIKKLGKSVMVSLSSCQAEGVKVGDFAVVHGLLTFPETAMNFGDFNSQRYYRSKGIVALCRNPKGFKARSGGFYPPAVLYNISEYTANMLNKYVGGENAEFAKGVLLGDKSGFSDELAENIKLVGISHVTAVSGMHVSILIMFLLMLSGMFTKRRKIKAAIVIFILLFYMALTGFSPSVVRAVTMNACVMLGVMAGRRANSILLLSIAAALQLIVNPYLPYNPSFMLSFISAAALIVFTPVVTAKLSTTYMLTETLIMTVIANLATLPYVLWNFEFYSWIGLFSNMLIVPLISFVFIGGFLTVCVGIIPPLGFLAGKLATGICTLVLNTTDFLANLPFGQYRVSCRNVFFIISYILLLCTCYVLLKPGKHQRTPLILFTVCALFFYAGCFNRIINTRDFSVTYLYVGQGDSCVVNIPGGNTYLIDTGGLLTKNKSYCLTYLKNNGVRSLDGIMISHSDTDHCGALESIIKEIPTDKIYITENSRKNGSSDRIIKTAEKYGVEVMSVTAGNRLRCGNAVFQFIHPSADIGYLSLNDGSMAINLEYKNRNFFFTGDISSEYENHVASFVKNCDVLKVAHHGSDTSTSTEFIRMLDPDYAVISSGINNIYSHPSNKVTRRLSRASIPTLITSKRGSVKFTVTKSGNMQMNTSILP